MSTTLSQARARLRRMLRETTANQWSDARLNELIQDSDWEHFTQMSRVRGSGFGSVQETITLAASATTFSLTPGTPPTELTYNLEAIIGVEHQGASGFWLPCAELPEGDEYRFSATNAVTATSDVPPLYLLRRPNIVFLPSADAARTLRVTYRPLPTALSADGTSLNCPDIRVALVCTRAAIFAMADIGEKETVYDQSYPILLQEMMDSLSHPQGEGRSLTPKLVNDLFF